MNLKEKKKKELYEEVRELYYNKGLSIQDLGALHGKTTRTIYRWLKNAHQEKTETKSIVRKKSNRIKKYPLEIFVRIRELKEKIPQRSAPMIERMLQLEYKDNSPSLSTIQKFLREEGLVYKKREQNQGYKKFQRDKPNDLWQVDIAGVQTVSHLKQLYLIALIDDCSRFVVAAEYFRTQKGINVLKVVRDAIRSQGRPNQILADRGTQFWNALGELGTKYSKLLESLDVKPIFARAYHPETKGKLERWFKTVIQMFLVEARLFVKERPTCSLTDFNQKFKEWVEWYNNVKPHGALPNRTNPSTVYHDKENRIYRPLKVKVNWDNWLQENEERKVTKYNTISYKAQNFVVPHGYMRAKVDVIEYEKKIEIY
jgi:transposase InsO family protein